MSARTRLGLTPGEARARAVALEQERDAFLHPPDGDRAAWDLWDEWAATGRVVTPGRRDQLVRRIGEVEADHLLDQVFPGRLPGPWSRLPGADAIDRVLDQLADIDAASLTRLAAIPRPTHALNPAQSAAAVFISNAGRRLAEREARYTADEILAMSRPVGLEADIEADARNVVADVLMALCVADYVGRGLPRRHVDALLAAWTEVMGDPREPGDPCAQQAQSLL